MNIKDFEKNYSNLKEAIQENWDKLKESDIDSIAGDIKKLSAKLMEVYGLKKAEAEQAIEDFLNKHQSFIDSLKNTSSKLITQVEHVSSQFTDEAAQCGQNLKKTIEKKPLTSIVMAALGGLVLGLLLKG